MPEGDRADQYSEESLSASDRENENAQAMRDMQPAGRIEVEIDRPKTAREKEEEKQRRLAELEEEARRQKEEEEYQKVLELRRKKRKLITPGVVLGVGLIASVTMFLMRFENKRMLVWLLVILLVSWFLGSLIQYMFERFASENENVSDEGEVINKGLASSEEVKAEENG